jgi:serine/threonine protein kinase
MRVRWGGEGANSTKEDSEDVEREVAIMYHLGGHDNIVNLKQAYEDKNNVQLVRVRGSLIAESRPSGGSWW